jgi:hypothetical protein
VQFSGHLVSRLLQLQTRFHLPGLFSYLVEKSTELSLGLHLQVGFWGLRDWGTKVVVRDWGNWSCGQEGVLGVRVERGEGRREKGEGRRERGEGRREKGEGRREKGEGRREKGEGRREEGWW